MTNTPPGPPPPLIQITLDAATLQDVKKAIYLAQTATADKALRSRLRRLESWLREQTVEIEIVPRGKPGAPP